MELAAGVPQAANRPTMAAKAADFKMLTREPTAAPLPMGRKYTV
jgi:hypothetical protein